MPLTIVFPIQIYPHSSDPCKWWAAHNPIIARVTREDETWSADANAGGNTRLTLDHPTPAPLAASDLIYFNNPAHPAQNGTYNVVGAYLAGVTTIDIACPYLASATPGYINYISLRKNYYIRTEYRKLDPASLPSFVFNLFGSRTRHVPDSDGLAKIDIAAILKNTVQMQDDISTHIALINVKDTNLSAIVDVIFAELWDGNESDYGDNIIWVTDSAMQIQHKYGSNLADYMPEENGVVPALFQCDFKRPTYWPGWPWDISFIFSLELGDHPNAIIGSIPTIYRVEDDMANNNLSATAIDATQKYFQNRLCLRGSYGALPMIKLYLSAKYIP